MDYGIADAVRAALDYLMRVAPPGELWRITLVTASTFAFVQAFKYITRVNSDGDGFGPAVLRGLGVIAGPVFAWVWWPVQEIAPILTIGLIGWGLAHLLNDYGFKLLERRMPDTYRTFEGRRYRGDRDRLEREIERNQHYD